MRKTVKVTTQPTVEPVTLQEVKLYARIDHDDEDPLLITFIGAAREYAEQYLRRSLITQTIRLTLDMTCHDEFTPGVYDLPTSALYSGIPSIVELPKGPVQSITSVTTYDLSDDSSTFSSANYRLNADGNRLVLTYGAIWPSNMRPTGAVEIVYVAGYGDKGINIPNSIRTAIMMHIQAMYEGRAICDMPDPCKRLLSPYRIMDSLAYG